MIGKAAWAHLKRVSASFRSSDGGNIAIIFSMTLVPVIFLAGAAVDYSGAANLKTKLQRATDGANMQLCQLPATSTQAQLNAAAQKYVTAYMEGRPFVVDSVVPTTNPRQIQLTTSANFSTSIVKAVNSNFATVPVKASSRCFSEQQTFEIALVLDNTGSMSSSSGGVSKLQAMKTAATNFVNAVFSDPGMAGFTKMSLVPFAATVAVPPSTFRNATWIDQQGKATHHWSFLQGGATAVAAYSQYGIKSRFDVFNYLKTSVPSWDWNGCFEALPYPLNTEDRAPDSGNKDSYYVPMFAPDESGDGGQTTHAAGSTTVTSANSYINDTNGSCAPTADEATRTGQACKYVTLNNPQTSGGRGPNFSCTTRPLTRLTTSQSTLTGEISALTALGNTNIHEGLMWGWRTISPKSVFTDGALYNKPYNNKIIVLMSDGMNAWNDQPSNYLKSNYSAYGFFRNPDGSTSNSRVPPANAGMTSSAQARAAIDAMTLESCTNARNAGVIIYTIGFSVSGDPIDTQGLKVLKDCAGNDSQSFVATDASTIDSVFQKIAESIGQLRLSM
jgi:Flp pilus assembly protein TadG